MSQFALQSWADADRMLARAVRPVVEGLENRRLLSADGAEAVAEEVLEEEVSADETYYTLELGEAVEGEEGEGVWMELFVEEEGEPKEEVDDGEIYEEWDPDWVKRDLEGGEDIGIEFETLPLEDGEVDPDMILTMLPAEGEEGEILLPEEGEDLDGDGIPDIIYTTTVVDEDGEIEFPQEEIDIDGDGIPDIIYYTTGGEDVDVISARLPRLKNNGKLGVYGTNGDDVITVDLSDDSKFVVVNVNGDEHQFDAADVEIIKVHAGNGNDKVTIDADIDARVRGQGGDDEITTGGGNDAIAGGDGDDKLSGRGGQDRVHGNRGDDIVKGGDDSDDCHGGKGRDKVSGGRGDDALRGGRGKDRINAGKGNDLMDGGTGADRIMAGEGTDGEQDGGDDILDPDAGDDLFSSVRMAHPGWWEGQSAAICHPDYPDCNDTFEGEVPIWWEDTGEAGDQLPDGTGGEDDVQGIDVGEPYPGDGSDERHADWYEGDDYNDTPGGTIEEPV